MWVKKDKMLSKLISIGILERNFECNSCNYRRVTRRKTLFIFGKHIGWYIEYIGEWAFMILFSILYPLSRLIFKFNLEVKEKEKLTKG